MTSSAYYLDPPLEIHVGFTIHALFSGCAPPLEIYREAIDGADYAALWTKYIVQQNVGSSSSLFGYIDGATYFDDGAVTTDEAQADATAQSALSYSSSCLARDNEYMPFTQIVGQNGVPASSFPLGQCEGDCDENEDCGEGLICFERQPSEPVPGCIGIQGFDTTADFCVSTSATCGESTAPVIPFSGALFEYVVDASNDADVLRGRVTYEGQGWIGFAISPSGNMIGSHAIIGLPFENTATRYLLNGYSAERPVAMAGSVDNLVASVTQNETHTVLQFTLPFKDPTDSAFDINPNGPNTFLIAAGSSNELGYHADRSPITVDLVPCYNNCFCF